MAKKKTYTVGYAKPPKKNQFKPGQSGNSKGRPKGVKNLATDLSEELSEKIQVTEAGKPRVITKQRAMIKALLAKSLRGDARAAATLLNLIPAVEQARQSAEESENLSTADAALLQTFRNQIAQELHNGKSKRAKR